MNNVSYLGDNIRCLRLKKKLSKAALAAAAGVGATTITEIENGKRQTLHADTLNKIAVALGTSVNELLNNNDNVEIQTNDICQIMSLIIDSDFMTLDGITLDKGDKVLLNATFLMYINALRYDRLKKGIKPNR